MGHGHVFVAPGTEAGRAAGQIADQAIGLYLEYLAIGYSEDAARAAAVAEITEGVSAEDDEDTRGAGSEDDGMDNKMYGCRWCDQDYLGMDELYRHAEAEHPYQWEAATKRPKRAASQSNSEDDGE